MSCNISYPHNKQLCNSVYYLGTPCMQHIGCSNYCMHNRTIAVTLHARLESVDWPCTPQLHQHCSALLNMLDPVAMHVAAATSTCSMMCMSPAAAGGASLLAERTGSSSGHGLLQANPTPASEQIKDEKNTHCWRRLQQCMYEGGAV